MVKIHRLKGDITPKIASSFKGSIAIDTEATGLKIPERDKLSLIQICGEGGEVYIIQPTDNFYKYLKLTIENELNIFNGDLYCFYIDYAGSIDVLDSIDYLSLNQDNSIWDSYLMPISNRIIISIVTPYARHLPSAPA